MLKLSQSKDYAGGLRQSCPNFSPLELDVLCLAGEDVVSEELRPSTSGVSAMDVRGGIVMYSLHTVHFVVAAIFGTLDTLAANMSSDLSFG